MYDEIIEKNGLQYGVKYIGSAKIEEYIATEEEIQYRLIEEQKQSRISELKVLITNLKLLDMDCTVEQTELRGLLGL